MDLWEGFKAERPDIPLFSNLRDDLLTAKF